MQKLDEEAMSVASLLEAMPGKSTARMPDLPTEVLGVVAEFLQSQRLFRSCANLNQTCRSVHEETQSTLWRIVTCRHDTKNRESRRKELIESAGARYIEFLIDINLDWEVEDTEHAAKVAQGLCGLPGNRLKAVLQLQHNTFIPEIHVLAYLTSKYVCNTADRDDMSTSLDLLCFSQEVTGLWKRDDWLRRLYIVTATTTPSCSSGRKQRFAPFPALEESSPIHGIIYQEAISPVDSPNVITALIKDFTSLLGRSNSYDDPGRPYTSTFMMAANDEMGLRSSIHGVSTGDEAVSTGELGTIYFSLHCDVIITQQQMMEATRPLLTTLNRTCLSVDNTCSTTISSGDYDTCVVHYSYPERIASMDIELAQGLSKSVVEYDFDEAGAMIPGTETHHQLDEVEDQIVPWLDEEAD